MILKPLIGIKKGESMRLELDNEQVQDLLELIYLGSNMANLSESNKIEDYVDLKTYVFQQVHKNKIENVLVLNEEDKELNVTPEIEDNLLDIIEAYDRFTMYKELATRLGNRDIDRKYGEDYMDKLEFEEAFVLMDKYLRRYLKEFTKNGINNLFLKKPKLEE